MKEFKVNEYLTLKLINHYTDIFVNNELFIQCKFLMLNIPIDKLNDFNKLLSIDEVAELSKNLEEEKENNTIQISPETEFWAHCSNK